MTPEEIAANEAATAAAEAEAKAKADAEAVPSQDNVKVELDKVRKDARTEAEKAEFSLKKNAERLKALGGDPSKVLGLQDNPESDDDKPITRREFLEMQRTEATKTALQLAEELANDDERELVKHYLQTRVVPTGNAQDDFKFALSAVSAVKNGQIAEELARKTAPKAFSSAISSPAPQTNAVFTPTEEEQVFMRPPFNMTQDDVIKARKEQESQQ